MKTRTIRAGIAGAALFAGAALVGGGALTATAAPTSQGTVHHAVPDTRAAGSYWTAEKMQAATPADVLIEGKTPSGDVAAAGAPTAVEGVEPRADQVAPISHVGKVFFTLGGADYVCSGNSVASANGNTVSTAGHCLNEGPGAFASNFVFVPAYENGAAPYGEWTATDLYAPGEWVDGGDITYDTGFAVVSGPGGSLEDAVGASGVAFNDARGLAYDAYGYPAGSPFDGETLQSCAGSATADPFGQSESQGIPCDMTGGSSGGPWFVGGAGGTQNSVNSFGYDAVADTMFGPYWGSVIEGAYQQASNG